MTSRYLLMKQAQRKLHIVRMLAVPRYGWMVMQRLSFWKFCKNDKKSYVLFDEIICKIFLIPKLFETIVIFLATGYPFY